jgi:hypothetical protein
LRDLQSSAKNLGLGSPGTSSDGVRLDCAVVRIKAVLVNPIGLGVPPTLAQPPGQLGQRVRVGGVGRLRKGLLGVGLPSRPLAQPPGQPAQRGWRQ